MCSLDDITDPLTPSHLLVGYRIPTLPDNTVSQDADDEHNSWEPHTKSSSSSRDLDKFLEKLEVGIPAGAQGISLYQLKEESSSSLQTGEVMMVYNEGHPQGLWRLGRIKELIPGADGKIRGVRVKVVSKGG